MFSKIVKHEFKSTYREYVPLYAIMLVCSLLLGLFIRNPQLGLPLVGGLFAIFSIATTAMFVLMIKNLIGSFGTRIFGKPGYLFFTTPASTATLIFAKVLVNVLWLMATIAAIGTSLFVTLSTTGVMGGIIDVFREILGMLPSISKTVQVLIVVNLFTSYLCFMIVLLFTFSFTSTIYKGEKKVLFGFGFYILVIIVKNLIQTLITPQYDTANVVAQAELNSVIFSIVYNVIITIGLLLSSWLLIEKKLELE